MTDRRVKECIIFNPETGISEDGTMHDGVYRPWINKPKKERKMTREDAIEILNNTLINWGRQNGKTAIYEAIQKLVEPPTLADFLGWEEGQEYKWRGVKYRIFYDTLQYFDEDERVWWDSIEELNDYLRLRQAKKVEEPRYLLQTDLESENGVQYLSFDKKRREYFMGALMANENVQQKFTDSEILKIESITRFAKLCEKIVLNDGIKI